MTSATLPDVVKEIVDSHDEGSVDELERLLTHQGFDLTRRHLSRILNELFGHEPKTELALLRDHLDRVSNEFLHDSFLADQRRRARHILICRRVEVGPNRLIVGNDRRGERWWVKEVGDGPQQSLLRLARLRGGDVTIVPDGQLRSEVGSVPANHEFEVADYLYEPLPFIPIGHAPTANDTHPHLAQLEAESIRIIREAVAAAQNPGMLFSMGKDSMVMWKLAVKAFWPEPPPFPLAVIDTRWKFRDMYRFRHYMEGLPETDVRVHINPDAIEQDVNPFDFGSARHTEITKTIALKQVLDTNQFDFVFGGARRDEERSRAKERVFSLRNPKHGWDPKAQRPELWDLYNTTLPKAHSMRVFPLSNWTELDIWRYIEQENIPVVPLYFSKVRPFVERDGALIMVDDERFRLDEGERIMFEPIRFRTLGCYPLTGGVRSTATTVSDIISELEDSRVSERSSRVIDFDPGASMEQKKKEGYF